MLKRLRKRFKRNEKGQGMVEYGLILALVSVVSLGALGGIGGSVSDNFNNVRFKMSSPNSKLSYGEVNELIVNENYIPIASPDELKDLREDKVQSFGKNTPWEGEYLSGLNKKYIQISDIDLSGIENFEPIGGSVNPFRGTFDGGKHSISNLTVDKDGGYGGLFGRVQGSTLKNIGLENVDIKGGRYVGGLVGYHPSGTISNSHVNGKVTGNNNDAGGLVGSMWSGSLVESSFANVDVSGLKDVGGLVGNTTGSIVKNSFANGNVSGHENVGGFIGYVNNICDITNSFSTGDVVSKDHNVGGFIGYQSNSKLSNSYSTGSVTGPNAYLGGFIGMQQGSTVTNCYATGAANKGKSFGMVGYHQSSSMENCSWNSDVNRDGYGRMVSDATVKNVVGKPKAEIDIIIQNLIK